MKNAPVSAEQQAVRTGEHAADYIKGLSTQELSKSTKAELSMMANWVGGNRTKQEIEAFQKLGERLSKIYMTGITVADSYGEAKEAGAAGIVVSNHGGRVLDGTPATAEVLEEKFLSDDKNEETVASSSEIEDLLEEEVAEQALLFFYIRIIFAIIFKRVILCLKT